MSDPKDILNTPDTTDRFDARDIEENRVMGVFAYLSWLVLIPLFAAKDSPFARFHCNQGIMLAIAELAVSVLCGILSHVVLIGWIFRLAEALVNLACVVLSVIGIVNASQGRAKELPVVGGFRLLK